MDILIPCLVALLASMLTFFSGFGLGTLLLPAFALIVPLQEAIILTALVHMLNNVFKLFLIGRHVAFDMAMRFSLVAIPASLLGGFTLDALAERDVIYSYMLHSEVHDITFVKMIIGILMLIFAAFEIAPRLKNLQFPPRLLLVGAGLSGFFGGLSGHQGALRSAFLLRAGLSKEAFIASGVMLAIVIDITRIPYYLFTFRFSIENGHMSLWVYPTMCAFAGAYIGNRLLKKIQIGAVQTIVAVMLGFIAVMLMTGVL